MGRRNDHSRQQIKTLALDAAEKIVTTHGLAGLTVRKIAAEIDYSAGTLYLVFENLDDIIMQVNARTLEQLHGILGDAIARCEQRSHDPLDAVDPMETICVMVNEYIEFVIQHSNRWRAMFDSRITELTELPDWYQAKVDALFILAERQLERLNPQLSHTQLQEAARALWCAVYGVCMLSGALKGAVSRSYTIHTLVYNLLNRYLVAFKQNNEEFAGEAA